MRMGILAAAGVMLLALRSPLAAQGRLAALASGDFESIGETPRDLLALHGFARGLGLGGCTAENGSLIQAARWTDYFLSGMTWAEVIQANNPLQPDLLDVVGLVESEGCDGPNVRAVKAGLIRLLDERSRPGRVRPRAPGSRTRIERLSPWPIAAMPDLDARTVQVGSRQLEDLAQAGVEIMECWYATAGGEVSYRLWLGGVPADAEAAQLVAGVMPVAYWGCPPSNGALDFFVATIGSPSREGIEEVVVAFDPIRHRAESPPEIALERSFDSFYQGLSRSGPEVLECRFVPANLDDPRLRGRRMQYELDRRSYFWRSSLPRVNDPSASSDTNGTLVDVLSQVHGVEPFALQSCPDVPGIRAYLR